jgi:succinate dehydrogenase iron-sulfur subunit
MAGKDEMLPEQFRRPPNDAESLGDVAPHQEQAEDAESTQGTAGTATPRQRPTPGGAVLAHDMVQLTLKIRRYNPEIQPDSWWDEYTVEVEPFDRLLDALHEVKWYHDGTLALRRSCAHGICGSDAMLINGQNALACKVLVKDVAPHVTVEPIRGLPVLKDLIVDMEPFFEGYRKVLPYLINEDEPPNRERKQSPEQRERYDDTTKCILCAACTTSCPIYWGDDGYIGPAAIVNAHRFIFDSRDQGGEERLKVLAEKSGVFRCRTTFNCSEACPRGIKVTKAIQEVKRAIMFDRL